MAAWPSMPKEISLEQPWSEEVTIKVSYSRSRLDASGYIRNCTNSVSVSPEPSGVAPSCSSGSF